MSDEVAATEGAEGADPVAAEIAALRAQIKVAQARIEELEKLRGHPTVVPVQVFWRYGSRYEEPDCWDSDEWDLLRHAYLSLLSAREYGEAAPEGVLVGGAFLSMDELARRYPDADRW